MSLQVSHHPSGSMIKLAMLGDGGVGKTALVVQLFLNKFVETYDPTIEDTYRKRIHLDNDALTLELMDTAGQEEYISLRDQWIRDGEGFLLVYSVTQKLSFTRIKEYYSEIKRIKDDVPFAVVLVGNKVDQTLERVVTTKEGEDLAKQWGIMFLETSAKLNINAEKAFVSLAQLTRDKHVKDAGESNNNRPGPPSGTIQDHTTDPNHLTQKAQIESSQGDQNYLYTPNSSLPVSKAPSQLHDKGMLPPNQPAQSQAQKQFYEHTSLQQQPNGQPQADQRPRQSSHISTASTSGNSSGHHRLSSSSFQRRPSVRVDRTGSQKKKGKCLVM